MVILSELLVPKVHTNRCSYKTNITRENVCCILKVLVLHPRVIVMYKI